MGAKHVYRNEPVLMYMVISRGKSNVFTGNQC